MDELIKNLWLLLTLVIPGMTTYGMFRLLLVLYDCRVDKSLFEKMDDSALLTTCLVVAIALVQQAIAIAIEWGISFICGRCKRVSDEYRLFFCNRFSLAVSGSLNDTATRIFGSFFTSVNITIGQIIIFLCLWYRGNRLGNPAMRVVLVVGIFSLASSIFRLSNVKSIIPLVEKMGTPRKTTSGLHVVGKKRSQRA